MDIVAGRFHPDSLGPFSWRAQSVYALEIWRISVAYLWEAF